MQPATALCAYLSQNYGALSDNVAVHRSVCVRNNRLFSATLSTTPATWLACFWAGSQVTSHPSEISRRLSVTVHVILEHHLTCLTAAQVDITSVRSQIAHCAHEAQRTYSRDKQGNMHVVLVIVRAGTHCTTHQQVSRQTTIAASPSAPCTDPDNSIQAPRNPWALAHSHKLVKLRADGSSTV